MKHFYTLLLLSLMSAMSFGQFVNKGIDFQGYAISTSGAALTSQPVSIRFTISSASVSKYVETHTVTTDGFGVFRVIIGTATPTTGTWAGLNFGGYNYQMKVEAKESGGSFAVIYDEELKSVAYAKQADNGVPPGTVMAFAGPEAKIPSGWARCSGQLVSKTADEWAPLYAAIGDSWGASGASFNLPNMNGMFLRGIGEYVYNPGSGLQSSNPDRASRIAEYTGGNTGDKVGTIQEDVNKSHSHTASQAAHAHTYQDIYHSEAGGPVLNIDGDGINNNTRGASGSDADNGSYEAGRVTGGTTPAITVNATGANEARPFNAAVYWIIKK